MKRLFLICALCLMISGIAFADEKTEYQWKARALVSELNYFQLKVNESNKAIQDLFKELDAKGYSISQDGSVVEKPKPKPKEESK